MADFSEAQLADMARQMLAAGDLLGAEGVARRAGNLPAGLYVLGVVALRRGDGEAARLYLQRAADAGSAEACVELGRLELAAGKAAVPFFQRALEIEPGNLAALQGLAEALRRLERWGEAAEVYALLAGDEAGRVRWADALWRAGRSEEAEGVLGADAGVAADFLRAEILRERGDVDGAEALYRRVVAAGAGQPEAWAGLGEVLVERARGDEALAAFGRAVEIDAGEVMRARTGHLAWRQLLLRGESARLERLVRDEPGQAVRWFEWGKVLQESREPERAIAAYRRAVEIEPQYVAARNNLGLALVDSGETAAGLEALASAAGMEGGAGAGENYLYCLHFAEGMTAARVDAAHREWARRHADPLLPARAHLENPRDPGKRLRFGIVGAHLFAHSVGRFLLRPLEHWPHEAAELVCYSTGGREDRVRARLRAASDRWVDARAMPDEALAAHIREDGVDVLLDVTMHMAGSRWATFARRAAPVQAAYLAYCSTTGLAAMDYRLTDGELDPGGRREFVEENLWLQNYWCYDPGVAAPAINALPALRRGHLTFASLNNFCKVSHDALETWISILREVEGAELVMQAMPGPHRERLLQQFAAGGVMRGRVRFFDRLSLEQYLLMHHAIDIALDPFAYAGGTTTCDALWMGVPTVSLVGEAPWQRGGASLLRRAGLGELAVESAEEYAATAVGLARDLDRLAEMRRTMRERMAASAIMNGNAFAADLVHVLRGAWRRWCASPG